MLLSLLAAIPVAAAAPWFQAADHPVHALFKRDGPAPDPASPGE